MKAIFMMDTDMCIYLKKRRPPSVADRFNQLQQGEVVISLITFGELLNGALKSVESEAAIKNVYHLSERLPVEPMQIEVATIYSNIRSDLEKKGQIIGNNDLWIAAHALSLGLTIITNNTREFSRISNLSVENWL